MSGAEQFRYDGKRALVVGGATGMGAAAAKVARDLGASVSVMDYAPVTYETDQVIEMDLRDRDSIDHAMDELPGPVDAVFCAAGIADGPDLMKTNFIGHRHLVELLLADDLLPRGSAICFISSVAGMGWENDLSRIQEFLATADYRSADLGQSP
jgi:NAD(P)-dependent dehydrogenase (short-subunit alcohol dehydrogenase family)